jgi:hypothetical protein
MTCSASAEIGTFGEDILICEREVDGHDGPHKDGNLHWTSHGDHIQITTKTDRPGYRDEWLP